MGGKSTRGSRLRTKFRLRQKSLDGSLDLPEAFQKVILRLAVRIWNVVSQGVVPGRWRVHVEQREQKDFRIMPGESPSKECSLTMLNNEDHVAFQDHVRCDRLRSVIGQVDGKGLRDFDRQIRWGCGYPNVESCRAGANPPEFSISRDLLEIPLGKRTPADISLA